jgi:protein tyrosine/serine phosphatase
VGVEQADVDRFVELEGCHNFRDLGGYATADGRRVRHRLVYRSAALHGLTASDRRRVREELGIGAIIDLRSEQEVRADGPGPVADPPVAYHHVPLIVRAGPLSPPDGGEPFALDRFYLGLLHHGGECVRAVVELLATARTPTVFHCAAGKDRTGIISAVLLALLGVTDAQVVEDYALTQRSLEGIRRQLLASESYRRMWGELPRESLHALPETMGGLLAGVRERWGSMSGYARAIGVDAELLAQLRARLLN